MNKMCISGLNHTNIRIGLHRNVKNVKIHNSVQVEFLLYSRYKSNIQYKGLSQNVTLYVTWSHQKWMQHTLTASDRAPTFSCSCAYKEFTYASTTCCFKCLSVILSSQTWMAHSLKAWAIANWSISSNMQRLNGILCCLNISPTIEGCNDLWWTFDNPSFDEKGV